MTTLALGEWVLQEKAAKNPAAPPPITAIFWGMPKDIKTNSMPYSILKVSTGFELATR